MNIYKGNGIGHAIAVAVFAGAVSYAQQEKVADQDLLNMLDTVNSTTSTPQEVAGMATGNTPDMDVAITEDVMVSEVSNDTNGVIDAVSVGQLEDAETSTDGNLISVRLNKVGLEEAINLFAQLSGANIIVPELAEAAQISVNLKDVEWRPALQSILDTYNYELYQRVAGSNVYAVRRRPAGAPEPQVVETFKLKYATVPNAAQLIRDLLPADAKISEFASRNMMVVKSTESSLGEVRAVLAAIDEVRQQVYIESKFMELSDDAQKDLGIDWSVLKSYGLGTQGSPEYDYSKQRVDNQFTDDGGQSYQEGTTAYAEPVNTLSGGPVVAGLTPTSSELTSQVLTSVLDADEFRVVLSALSVNKGVNIVSNPKIIVANEELANISIVRKEPNLKQSRQEALNDNQPTIVYELDPDLPFFEYGIVLDVTPSVNTSSNITVAINPSLTRKYADKQAGDNTYPIIDEKTIDTVFNLSSGQTAAIGGLTEITEGEEERKVPVLGSIPYLGRLFSWNRAVSGQNETIIFVTVGLANTEQLESGSIDMPDDAELARRQMIRERNQRIIREQSREYFEVEEAEKTDGMLKAMEIKELEREARQQEYAEKTAEKYAKREAKLAE